MNILTTRTTLGLWVALLMLLVIGIASTLALQNIQQANLMERHTREVQAALNAVLDDLQDAETGQRGFLLTGNPLFLQPYNANADQVAPDLQHLRALTADNPLQQRSLDRLEPVALQRMDLLAQMIALHRQNKRETALASINSGKGKELMDAARTVIADMQAEEQRLLMERQNNTSGTIRTAFFLILLGSLALLIVVARSTVKIQQEIRGRQRSEDDLRESRERLAVTLHSIGDAVLATDAQQQVTFMNSVAERLTGWTQAEAKGRDAKQIFPIINETTRLEVESPITRAIQENRIIGLANHTLLIARNGDEIPIDDSAAPIRDALGNLIGVILVFRDITVNRQKEEALRQHQERLRLAVDAARMGTWDYNPVTGTLQWDARCKEMFGLPPDAAVDYGVFLAGLHPDDREKTHETVQRSLDPNGMGEYDIEYRTVGLQDGIERWVRATGQAVFGVSEGQSRALRFIGTILDITSVKRQQSEIEDLNSRLQRAFAESHHRIKNNLQVLAALVDMQRMNNSETVPITELGRLSQHIRALASLHDLLTQESRLGGDLDTVSLKTALEKLIGMMQVMAGDRRISLKAEEMRMPLKQGGSFMLLVNELVSNAIKHGIGNIEVTLASAPLTVARLEVCDDGKGFPADFDPLTAANTGLELIESMGRWDLGGEILYENRAEGGARVVVIFPLTAPLVAVVSEGSREERTRTR